jgi:hypothetical protein
MQTILLLLLLRIKNLSDQYYTIILLYITFKFILLEMFNKYYSNTYLSTNM